MNYWRQGMSALAACRRESGKSGLWMHDLAKDRLKAIKEVQTVHLLGRFL